MPNWIYRVFIRFLPKILLMTPPAEDDAQSENDESISISGLTDQSIWPVGSSPPPIIFRYPGHLRRCPHLQLLLSADQRSLLRSVPAGPGLRAGHAAAAVPVGPSEGDESGCAAEDGGQCALCGGVFPRKTEKGQGDTSKGSPQIRAPNPSPFQVSENWSYVAMVLDRLLLIVFSTSLFIGTLLILSSSPPAKSEWGQPLGTMAPTKPLSGDTFEFELRETLMSTHGG